MNKVKILFADHTPFIGGAQLRLAEDLAFLDKTKFDPTLVVDAASPNLSIYQKSKVRIVKISFPRLKLNHPVGFFHLIRSVKSFTSFVKRENPQIVVANTTRTLLVAALSKKISKQKFRLVSYIRDYDYPRWIFKIINSQIDKYLFVSLSIKQFYTLPGEVIYLGSDILTGLSKVSTKEINSLKTKLKIKKEDLVLGYLGRLVDWKGGMTLLKAVDQLKNPDIKLVFIGTGQNQAGSIEEDLKKYVIKHQLKNQVLFIGQTSSPEQFLKLIDIFVLPSIKDEPFATSVIEAALAKKPIIATQTGGTSEFIQDQDNGLLVDPDDTNQLAQALIRLVEDQKFAQKLATKAYQDAQKFQQKIFIKKLEKELLK